MWAAALSVSNHSMRPATVDELHHLMRPTATTVPDHDTNHYDANTGYDVQMQASHQRHRPPDAPTTTKRPRPPDAANRYQGTRPPNVASRTECTRPLDLVGRHWTASGGRQVG